jgi:TolB-like protein/Flp pilus assembly protein TadD
VTYTVPSVNDSLLRFDRFELDVSTGELRKGGSPLKLPPQPTRVLALLAKNAGRLVTREHIRTEVWRGDTFVDFEQGLNHCIKLIRAALGDDARTPRFIETLQKRGYRFVAAIDRAAATTDPAEKVILVVLPFENLSADPDQEYFSDGLTDEMITQLARINPARLGVVGRTSAMKYKKSGRTIAEIGRELSVAYALEGSVRRSAGLVRITSQLVRVADQTQVWTQSFDRGFDDILRLQSDIAQAIAREIDIRFAPAEAARLARQRGVSSDAHEAYLKGRYFWNKRTADAFKKGIEYFSRAIEYEPNYAAAYDGLCDSYVMLACRGVLPVTEAFRKAKDAGRQALAIDPDLGEAHASLAHVRLHAWDWNGLDAEFRRALEINPAYAMAHYWYAEYLIASGRPDDAVAMVRKALSIDPLSSVLSASMGMILYLARRMPEAIDALRKGLEMDPGHFLLHFRLGLVHMQAGSPQDAINEMRHAVELSGRSTETLAGLAQAYAAAGINDEMGAILGEIVAQTDRYVSPYNVARVYAAQHDPGRTFEWLERAYDERNPDLIELRTDPVFDSLRGDSRFADLLRRIAWHE